jgi:hypothetical protein
MAILTLTLNKNNIIDAVKSDTYITGQVDKSIDGVKNAALAYNEQAGDDGFHEVKLYRTLRASLAKFEAAMSEYVDTSDPNATISNTLSNNSETFSIIITVGARFNRAFATTLSALAEDFMVNMMLYTWWQSAKPTLAKDYYTFAQESLLDVRKCLAKSAPQQTSSSYNNTTGTVTT